MSIPEITADYVRSILDYDPETGVFTWKQRPPEMFRDTAFRPKENTCDIWNTRFSGKISGWPNGHGYIEFSILGKKCLAHRIAWLYMTGEWPKHQIDHVDCDRSNNTFSNLRKATHGENQRNCGVKANNTSGHKGVRWHSHSGKWQACIRVEGERHHLGSFESIEDAAKAYECASSKFHGKFARVA
ncbi:MAG: HNH endonuclease [Hyphomicrobium sp.]|uniref:HNH endonuclease n=1 Tax=Hyphomicrobium sp. TaxID=82 RepID=UPI003569336B